LEHLLKFKFRQMAGRSNPNENESGRQQYYPIAVSQSSPPRTIDASEDAPQHEGQKDGAVAANIGYEPAAEEPEGGNQDCFRVVRSSKFLEIPCTINEYRKQKVRVAKQVSDQVPRRVEYTEYETRERQEPYTVKRFETAYREEDQEYTVQVPKKVKRMVKVNKKIPKTVYVDVLVEEPRFETIMIPETRNRRVKVPYQKEVVDQKYRTIKESVPVIKYRTEYDTVSKTVYEDEWRTRVVPVTKLVKKELPVYNVVRNEDCDDCTQVDGYPLSYVDIEAPVQVPPGTTSQENKKPSIDTYPPYVETHPEPTPTYQIVQPVTIPDKVDECAPAPENPPVYYPKEAKPDQVTQAPEYIPVKEPTPVTNVAECARDSNVEQKVDKWVEMQYSAPAQYDKNHDGVLDAQEREVAKAEGDLHLDRIAVVENTKDGSGVVVEEASFTQPQRQGRRRKKKKVGQRRRRRRNRR